MLIPICLYLVAIVFLNNSLQEQPQFIIDETTGQITAYKTKAGADTEFPFSSKIENIYHFSNVASNSNQTAPIDYKHIVLEGASTTPMTAFSINGTSYFSEFTKGEDSSNGERLFLNHDGKIGDILKGIRTSNSTFSILLIN